MSNKKERRRIVKELLDVTDKEFTDEELIHQLINTELSKDSDKTDKLSFGQRAADAVARFAGSWAFIFSFIAIMVIQNHPNNLRRRLCQAGQIYKSRNY